jgi:hypothetical protein
MGLSLAITALCGLSMAACGQVSEDAGAQKHTADAGADRGNTKVTRPVDGGSVDAGRGEAGRRDTGSVDAGSGRGSDAGVDVAAGGVTRIAISPLTLTPKFSTAIHDYYVRCAAGTNALTVTMTAATGSTIALMKPTTTAASTDETTAVSVTENEAIVVGLTTGSTTDEYWIRCLPHDFPRLEMTLHPDAGTPTAGYYLIGNMAPGQGGEGYAAALDVNGVPVWYRVASSGQGVCDVENLVTGTISFAPFVQATTSSSTGQFELDDLLTQAATYVEPSGAPLDPRELRVLSNGDYLVIASPVLTGVDLTGLGFSADASMVECEIQEVSPAGALVWKWDATDHFDPVQDSLSPEVEPSAGATVVDPYHCNSIDVDSSGNFLVSSADMDSVFLVSSATGTVLWKMGGAKYNKDSAPYIAVQNDPMTAFYRQHDVRIFPDGGVSMFDDQTGKTGPARAVIFAVDADAGTATPAWQYKGTATSNVMGSFRISADGSRVVGWGQTQTAARAFTEVDVNGHDLLDFAFPGGDTTYRAIKIPTTAFDLGVLRATAGTD